jgi:glucan phosphoethanolaminetransferase (alkaline phosphatase superfamily)
MNTGLCPPAIIYLFFSITQIIIDLFKGLYNTASVKAIVMVIITILLNILCSQGLGVVSWIIVFIPFILMTVIVTLILYAFGLDAATGKLEYVNNTRKDAAGNILVYDPNYNPNVKPVYYDSPNIVIPNPSEND